MLDPLQRLALALHADSPDAVIASTRFLPLPLGYPNVVVTNRLPFTICSSFFLLNLAINDNGYH
jgi:hypothetical protein